MPQRLIIFNRFTAASSCKLREEPYAVAGRYHLLGNLLLQSCGLDTPLVSASVETRCTQPDGSTRDRYVYRSITSYLEDPKCDVKASVTTITARSSSIVSSPRPNADDLNGIDSRCLTLDFRILRTVVVSPRQHRSFVEISQMTKSNPISWHLLVRKMWPRCRLRNSSVSD